VASLQFINVQTAGVLDDGTRIDLSVTRAPEPNEVSWVKVVLAKGYMRFGLDGFPKRPVGKALGNGIVPSDGSSFKTGAIIWVVGTEAAALIAAEAATPA
jgi:hypothetical protein